MYKEPFCSDETNQNAKTRVDQKTNKVAEKLVDPEASDADFFSNLHDLCVLNRMAESHETMCK